MKLAWNEIRIAWCGLFGMLVVGTTLASGTSGVFRVWAVGDSHASGDLRHGGRESLAIPIRQAAGLAPDAPGFDWDIMVDAGDHCGSQLPPDDAEGRVLVAQYRALTNHYREDVYQVAGNHDADYYDQGAGTWFSKWLDPLGEHTEFSEVHPERRRFPVEGAWERYKFQAGNILFLMMSDMNSAPEPVGRGNSEQKLVGGFPAGAVTRATFNWWKEQVLANQDKIIITMHHHMLRDTTTWALYLSPEKRKQAGRFHGKSGGIEGSGYLYHIIENPDPSNFVYTADAHVFEDFLESFEIEHGKPAIDLWLGGHSHPHGPEHEVDGQGLTETKWGVTFVQCGALTAHHAGGLPMSRLITFTAGSDQADIRMYLHEGKRVKQMTSKKPRPLGWHEPSTRPAKLRHSFVPPPPDPRRPPPVYAYTPSGSSP